jgi:hypothetical protein
MESIEYVMIMGFEAVPYSVYDMVKTADTN